MPRLQLMVDRELEDGRLVVINDSRENAPVGTVFTSLFARRVQAVGGEYNSEQCVPPIPVALVLESVEWFRRNIDAVPFGHNAAVVLTGDGLAALKEQLGAKTSGVYVFLGAE